MTSALPLLTVCVALALFYFCVRALVDHDEPSLFKRLFGDGNAARAAEVIFYVLTAVAAGLVLWEQGRRLADATSSY